MLNFSDNDGGAYLVSKLKQQGGRMIGDGSYERADDHGGAAVILESNDGQSRAINTLPVPSNMMTLTRLQNDPYRCELFSLLMGLLLIHTLEQDFDCTFPEITVAVDNDAAVDMAILYSKDIEAVDQHHDLLRSIRHLRSLIKTPLRAQHVEGHKDRYTAYDNLARNEQLN